MKKWEEKLAIYGSERQTRAIELNGNPRIVRIGKLQRLRYQTIVYIKMEQMPKNLNFK